MKKDNGLERNLISRKLDGKHYIKDKNSTHSRANDYTVNFQNYDVRTKVLATMDRLIHTEKDINLTECYIKLLLRKNPKPPWYQKLLLRKVLSGS